MLDEAISINSSVHSTPPKCTSFNSLLNDKGYAGQDFINQLKQESGLKLLKKQKFSVHQVYNSKNDQLNNMLKGKFTV
jgi:hypothetical protein